MIYDLEEFRIVQGLCNHSKHMERVPSMAALHQPTSVDEWPENDAVRDFDAGPPTHYFVEGRDVLDIAGVALRYYEFEWFNKQSPT
jgi:hypothetical protein